MPVTDVAHDLDARTITITAEFAAPVERIWEVFADPEQFEQIFAPTTHPATFVEHDLSPGGRSHYFVTSTEGVRYYGWWLITAVDAPNSFTFDEGFAADDSFTPRHDLPVSRGLYVFEATEVGTRATFTGTYESLEDLQQMLEVGVVELASAAIDQIDVVVEA